MSYNPIIEADLKAIIAAPLPWEQFRDKTVLVTGASGMIAAYMVETLLYLNQNTRVIALVRNRKRAEERFATYEWEHNFRISTQDVNYPLTLAGKVDTIIHAGSHASRGKYETDPTGTLAPNVIGTYNLLELAREKGASFLFFSSDIAAQRLGAPWAYYAESKYMGEVICAAFRQQYGMDTHIIRAAHTYGPGLQFDGRVYAEFVKSILEGFPLIVNGDGSTEKPFCYLADAVAGYFTALLKGDHEPYNVGSDQRTSIRALAEKLAEMYQLPVEYTAPDPTQRETKPLDLSRIRALGWEPTTSIEAGFKRTVDYYESL